MGEVAYSNGTRVYDSRDESDGGAAEQTPPRFWSSRAEATSRDDLEREHRELAETVGQLVEILRDFATELCEIVDVAVHEFRTATVEPPAVSETSSRPVTTAATPADVRDELDEGQLGELRAAEADRPPVAQQSSGTVTPAVAAEEHDEGELDEELSRAEQLLQLVQRRLAEVREHAPDEPENRA